ncbi:crotonase/enoyl-CoA hydratase family protein [Marinobacter sp.]|uniref:crotonase/enoyl-CoA hydratase family protein n=1 Tax=Marinobacter sp. TaxID=50741 RepID=UPI001B66E7D9|nr:crotonase/enoyl-CoA hydratase family protein [Marinobacter sp.]MBQ0832371.1 crotonase/enoyl-CoA hydratase family protein [Marinobacter sp.]
MTDLVNYTLNDGVATIVINNGKANALNHQVFEQLNKALDQAEQDKAVVILTGQPGIFSAGYDLKEMQKGMNEAAELVAVGSIFTRRLAAFPFPIIGACSGHALAKAAFILLSLDYRVGIEGSFKLGLNEVAIGMTMHHAGIEIARHRLAPAHFYRSVINAEIYSPEGAVAAGYLDEVVAPDQLLTRANELAQGFRKLNMRAHAQTKLKTKAAYLELLDLSIKKDSESLGLSG